MTGTHYEKTSKYAKGAKSLGLASTDHNDTSERRGDVCRAFQRNATIISPTKDKPLSR
jgi:hypothetical protein